MKTGKFLRKLALILSFVMLLTSTVNTTYGYMFDSTKPLVNVFVPEDRPLGGIALEKIVEHPFGDDYKIPESIAFPFSLELGAFYANAEISTSHGKLRADASGRVQVQIQPGIEFRVEHLQEGTTVKVTELPVTLSGFSVKGDASKNVTITADDLTAVSFTNIYTPIAAKGNILSLSGSKTLVGRDWQEGDSFTVKLEQQSGNDWKQLGTQTIRYDPNDRDFNRFDFDSVLKQLTFDKIGTYTFRVSEGVGNLENMTYDQTVNHFQVKVTDTDMDGALEIQQVTGTENTKVTEKNGKFQIDIPFNNTYVPPALPDPEPVMVQVSIKKTVDNTGTKKIGPKDFAFLLAQDGTHNKWEVKSDVNGDATINLVFTKADIGKTYTYQLSETNTNRKGVTYDTSVYAVSVSVGWNEEDNTLLVTSTLNGEETKNPTATFHNTYYIPPADIPKTGDPSNVQFWLIMIAVSGSAFMALLIYEIIQRKKEKG